jgi:NAD(P)H-nitrite reductase large subunit
MAARKEQMVTHCVCYEVSFARMKRLIDGHGLATIDDLRAHVEFGLKCGMCLPYVERIFREGGTAFEPEWQDDESRGVASDACEAN